jgi:hypothetical protein
MDGDRRSHRSEVVRSIAASRSPLRHLFAPRVQPASDASDVVGQRVSVLDKLGLLSGRPIKRRYDLCDFSPGASLGQSRRDDVEGQRTANAPPNLERLFEAILGAEQQNSS